MTELRELLTDYLLLRYEQGKLDIEERIDKLAHSLINIVIISILLSSAFLFLSLALAFWLNAVLESRFLGFLLVGITFLLVLLLFVWIGRHIPIYRKLVNRIKERFNVA